MVWVVKAQLKEDYKVYVEFNDGVSGVIDFYDELRNDPYNIFQELLDLEKFKTVKVDLDTLCWDNGLDLAPEYLYDMIKHQQKAA